MGLLLGATIQSALADPRLESWFTERSGQYARIYETTAHQNATNSSTTWSRATIQTLPAYSGVQAVMSSETWVYIRTTGLGYHIMGPWYLDALKANLFPNLPANTATLYRFPRVPAVPGSKTLTGLGAIGYFVDGVAMFDGRDGFYWNGSAETGGNGTGYWNRDAYVNEGVTFDPAFAHQEQTGTYHYHANPIALRHLMGDHVDFNSQTQTYAESTNAVTHHSPILGWVRDGFPIYGPYGYGESTNAASGIRRMVSGYWLRNGQNGTDNLTVTGRASIPAWAQRAYGVGASQSGPGVSATYPLGRYMEDKVYRGDLGESQGVAFDLDEYNGRFCVTPEFPLGTYAYFVSINPDGSPAFPYNIGRRFYGAPNGSAVTTVAESVTTNFVGGPDATLLLDPPATPSPDTVTLVWSSVDGGAYQVEASSNLTHWSVRATNVLAAGIATPMTFVFSEEREFYRVVRSGLAAYDDVGGTGGGADGGITGVLPTSGARGTQVTVSITLSQTATPGVPPQQAPVNSVTAGPLTGTSVSRPTQYTIQATFTIPADATPGAQTVTVVFPGPPGNPGQTVTYTLTNGFTIT